MQRRIQPAFPRLNTAWLCLALIALIAISGTNRPTATVQPTKSTICLIAGHCPKKQVSKRHPHLIQTSKRHIQPPAHHCRSNTTIQEGYTRSLQLALSDLNQSADHIRMQAQLSGKSYIVFDQQMDNAYQDYNNKVQALYLRYRTHMDGCRAISPPPLMFSLFMP